MYISKSLVSEKPRAKTIHAFLISMAIFLLLVVLAIGPRAVRLRVATHGLNHVVIHIVAFAFLTCALWVIIPFKRPLMAAGFAVAMAASLEALQSFHFGTRFETRDVAYAIAGSVIGLLLINTFLKNVLKSVSFKPYFGS